MKIHNDGYWHSGETISLNDDINPRQEGRAGKSLIREILETLLLTLIIFILVRSVVQTFKVDGHSMDPSLRDGEYILVNKAVYFRYDANWLPRLFGQKDLQPKLVNLFHGPDRGDIVVLEPPQDPGKDYIKRVVGLPGDVVELRNDHLIYVNDQPLNEPYILEQPIYEPFRKVLAADQFFVMGDNRNNSSDSHVWGALTYDKIVGKAWIIYWPKENWGFVPHQSYSNPPKSNSP